MVCGSELTFRVVSDRALTPLRPFMSLTFATLSCWLKPQDAGLEERHKKGGAVPGIPVASTTFLPRQGPLNRQPKLP